MVTWMAGPCHGRARATGPQGRMLVVVGMDTLGVCQRMVDGNEMWCGGALCVACGLTCVGLVLSLWGICDCFWASDVPEWDVVGHLDADPSSEGADLFMYVVDESRRKFISSWLDQL